MRSNITRNVLIVLCCFSPVIVNSQNVEVKESGQVIPDFLHEYFRPVPGYYIDIDYSAPHGAFSYNRNDKKTKVTAYNTKLQEIYSTPVKELSGKKYQGGIEVDNNLHLFFSDNKKVYTCGLDPTNGKLKGTPVFLFTAAHEPSAILKGFSTDSSLVYAIFKSHTLRGKDEFFDGVVLDRSMNMLSKFSFKLEGLKGYIDNTTCLLNAEGLLYIINSVRIKTTKKDFRPLQYLITEIKAEESLVTTYIDGFPEGRLANIVWHTTTTGLSFTGLLAKSEKEAFRFLLSGEYSSWQKKVTGIKEMPVETIPANAETVNSFTYADSSVILIMQPTTVIYSSRGNFSYTDSYAAGLYILKITPQKEAGWLKTIPLSQGEPTEQIFTGAIAMRQNKKDIYLFFLDNKKNDKTETGEKIAGVMFGTGWDNVQLVAVRITPAGEVSRNKTAATANAADYHLAPHQPFAIYDDELIYSSFHRRNLGKSTHMIGVIRFK